MNSHNDHLHTPIFVKLDANMPLPEDAPVFHLLTRDGLFLCRNHPFFRSSVRVDQCPSELAAHQPFLKLHYPKLPQRLVEQVVGFFSIVGRQYASEAAVLLAWNKTAELVVPVVPEQTGIVCQGWSGNPFPMELHYEIPPLPPHQTLIGDVHSHVDGSAYASSMDKADEEYRAGLHIVIGRLQEEPPEFHCEVTVDGARFHVRDLAALIGGYQRRREREVPQAWLDKLSVKSWNPSIDSYIYQRAGRASQEVPDAMIVDDVERRLANGEKSAHEIATATAPLVVAARPDSPTRSTA